MDMRRFVEILFATIALALASPVIFLGLVLVRLTSPGPALFRQTRVGVGKKEFVCLKLRTMKTGTKQLGTHEVSASSVTPVGKFLRATKLDELPQLINILRGEMGFVGPRPCLPSQVELIEERDSRGVFTVLPGITGLGQVRGIDMSEPARLAECDAEYVRNRSLWFDIQLVWRTFLGSGRGDRVRSVKDSSNPQQNQKKIE